MSALLVLNYDVTDPEKLAVYREAATPVLIGPGRARLLTTTPDTTHLDEAPARGTHTVVLEFDSVERARAVYESRAYQQVLGDRLAATTPQVAMIVPLTEPR